MTPELGIAMIARGYRALTLSWSLLQRGLAAGVNAVKCRSDTSKTVASRQAS